MTRSIIRRIRWTMSPDPAPDAPEMIHELRCATCGAVSGAEGDFEAVRDWAFAHTGGNPSHRRYRETVTRAWRMTPAEGECL